MSPGSEINLTESRVGDVVVLIIGGRIDSTNSEVLLIRVSELFRAGAKSVLLDFANVLYLTSAAFRVLLVATDEAEHHSARLVLCCVQGQVRELFEMGGLLEVFTINESRELALGLLS